MRATVARRTARALGLPRYFTATACLRGHVDERYTKSKLCVSCIKEYDRHRQAAPDFWKRKYAQNPASGKQRTARYRAAYPEKIRAANARRDPAMMAAHARRRDASKCQRSPVWADHQKMREVYATARFLTELTGTPHHVDHIVPLHGRRVSGLHVHENLQVLPRADNLRKTNHFEVC